MLEDLTNAGAAPALEQTIRFAGHRQRLLAHNIANLETPDFRAFDLSTRDFQQALGDAIRERRERTGGEHGGLRLRETAELIPGPDGALDVRPRPVSDQLMQHNRNNTDVERLMKDLAENVIVHRTAVDLLRKHHELLRAAIAQRP